jgi:hypothetical protein
MACYVDRFTFLYVDDVRTSQQTHVRASYEDNVTFLYVDDTRTSQQTHVWACDRDKFPYPDPYEGCHFECTKEHPRYHRLLYSGLFV